MDRPNNRISKLLNQFKTCIGAIVSSIAWESLTPEEAHTQNDLELLCIDAGIAELESKGLKLPQMRRPRICSTNGSLLPTNWPTLASLAR